MQEISVPKNDSPNPIILSTKNDSIFKLACYKGHNYPCSTLTKIHLCCAAPKVMLRLLPVS